MALILHIETATDVCSVSLAIDGLQLAIAESSEPKSHAIVLTDFIQRVLSESGKKFSELDAVAVSKGPGSYTGLRIGVATAKGLCYALNKPMIAINTLHAMTSHFLNFFQPDLSRIYRETRNPKPETLYAPLIDARRMEVYAAIFDYQLNFIVNTKAEIIDENSFAELLKEKKIFFFGDGVKKCISILGKNKNAVFRENFTSSAQGMVSLAEIAFKEKQFENIAYFEPFYLKDFVTTTPKNK